MTKRAVIHAFAWLVVSSMTVGAASAQVLNFSADPDEIKTPQKVERFRADRPSPHFPAGSGVWAILFVGPQQGNLGDFSTGQLGTAPANAQPLKLTVSLLNAMGNFDDLYAVAVDLQDPTSDHVVFPVLPDAYDHGAPGFDALLTRLEQHKKGVPLQVKVRVESTDPQYFAQNGFILDDERGLGRYQAWLDQRSAERGKVVAAKIPARTRAVRAFRSPRSDAKVEADARKWWKAHVDGHVLDGVKTCSDMILVGDRLGSPMEKQWCVLYTYRGAGKCWAQMRRLSYRRLGKDTYDSQLVDSTYATMQLPVGDEQLTGAREYEIACK